MKADELLKREQGRAEREPIRSLLASEKSSLTGSIEKIVKGKEEATKLIINYYADLAIPKLEFLKKQEFFIDPEKVEEFEKEIQEMKKKPPTARNAAELIALNKELEERTSLLFGDVRRSKNPEEIKKYLEEWEKAAEEVRRATLEANKRISKLPNEQQGIARGFIPKTRSAEKELKEERKDIEEKLKKARRERAREERKKRTTTQSVQKRKPEAIPASEMARIVRAIESTPKVEKYLSEVMLAERKKAEEQVKKEMGELPSEHDLIKQAMRNKEFRKSMSAEARKRGYGSVEKYVKAIINGKETKVPRVARPLIEQLSIVKNEEGRVKEILAKDEAYQAAKKALESHEKALKQAEAGRLQALLKRTKEVKFSESQKTRIRGLLRRGRRKR